MAWTALLLVMLTASESAGESPAWRLPARSLQLDNGMEIVVVRRPGSSMVAAGWVVRSGSAADPEGRTGIAHLVEHLLFRGSRTLGVVDGAAEAKLLAEREQLEDELRSGAAGGRVRRQIDAAEERLQALRLPGETSRLYAEAGALGSRALTTKDFSVYTMQVPRSHLELWFWIESNRLLEPVFRGLYSEYEVLEEERRQRVEATTTGLALEQLNARFWGESHPYARSTDGRPGEIRAVRTADVAAFFGEHYRAGNLAAVLVGDVDPQQVLQLARRYFGRLPGGAPAGSADQLAVAVPDRAVSTCSCRGRVELRWPTVPLGHEHAATLELLAGMLNGRTGRLYRQLVLQERVAFAAGAQHTGMLLGGFFSIWAEPSAGTTTRQLRAAMERVVADLLRSLPDEEVLRARSQVRADGLRELQDPMPLLLRLLSYEALADWRLVESRSQVQRQLEAEAVSEVTRSYLGAKERSVLVLESAR